MKQFKNLLPGLLVIALSFAGIPFSQTAHAYGPALLSPYTSAVLWDASAGTPNLAKNSQVVRPPASTTKLLTSLVAMETLPLNAVVTVPAYVQRIEPSKIHLRGGEKYYVRDLIRAILLNSANDAAEVLAVGAGGSRSRFGKMMTRKARQLGCRNSNFVNPSGLPDKAQYSTAYDMVKIMQAVSRNPFLVETLGVRNMTIVSLSGRRIGLRNHNKMLWRDSRRILGKTGWTRSARHCFVGMMSAYGRKIYVSMLGSKKIWVDLKRLVDYQFGQTLRKYGNKQAPKARLQNKQIQAALKKAGYYKGSVDGIMGKGTQKALRQFQEAKGLQSDGIVGPVTVQKLQHYL